MKRRIGMVFGLVMCLFLCACGEKKKADDEMYVYYLNADKNALIQEIYPMLSVEGTLKKLEFHGVLTPKVKVERFRKQDGNLDLFFNSRYSDMDKSTEVLTRAAIVQTMTQLEDIQFVTFYVGESLLEDGNGVEIGNIFQLGTKYSESLGLILFLSISTIKYTPSGTPSLFIFSVIEPIT